MAPVAEHRHEVEADCGVDYDVVNNVLVRRGVFNLGQMVEHGGSAGTENFGFRAVFAGENHGEGFAAGGRLHSAPVAEEFKESELRLILQQGAAQVVLEVAGGVADQIFRQGANQVSARKHTHGAAEVAAFVAVVEGGGEAVAVPFAADWLRICHLYTTPIPRSEEE